MTLTAVTLGAAALTALTWDRPRLRRVRRLCALLGTQLLVVVLGLSVVNASQGFFTSWSDFSGGEAHGSAQTVTSKERTSGSQLRPAVEAAKAKGGARGGRGVIISSTITGKHTGYALPVRVYLPAAYFDPRQPDRRFPVVMFFAGFLGSVDTFQQRLGADRVLDDLISSGRMQPVVVVMPEKNPDRLKDSECIDAVGGRQADTYLAQDVPAVIKNELRVSRSRTGWAYMGYSTGGFCATNLALRHSDVVATAVNLSGNYVPYIDETTGDLFKDDDDARRRNTPAETLHRPRECPLSFYLFASKGDTRGAQELRDFTRHIKPPDAATVVTLSAGGHNFNVWREALPGAFTWLGRVLHAYGSGSCAPGVIAPRGDGG